MIIALLSGLFTLIGFMLLGYLSVAYLPFVLLCTAAYLLYKFRKIAQAKQSEKYRPDYQSGGISPQGVNEDISESTLSFKPKTS